MTLHLIFITYGASEELALLQTTKVASVANVAFEIVNRILQAIWKSLVDL
jgi:hypothetical protein